jgi:hypothetical protein
MFSATVVLIVVQWCEALGVTKTVLKTCSESTATLHQNPGCARDKCMLELLPEGYVKEPLPYRTMERRACAIQSGRESRERHTTILSRYGMAELLVHRLPAVLDNTYMHLTHMQPASDESILLILTEHVFRAVSLDT